MLLRAQDEDDLDDIAITAADNDAELAEKVPRELMGFAMCIRDILRLMKIVENEAYALEPHGGPRPCERVIRIRGSVSSPDRSVYGVVGEE